MKKVTGTQVEKLLTAVLVLLIQGWILKLLWNWLGPAQGLEPVTWIQTLGWMIFIRTLTGTGEILAAVKKGAKD